LLNNERYYLIRKGLNMGISRHFPLISRRGLIVGLGASLLAKQAYARIGWSASPELIKAFRSMPHIKDGTSSKLVYVLTTPWCPRSPELYESSRRIINSGQISFAWIPYSGGQPEGSNAVERLSSGNDVNHINSIFEPIKRGTVKQETPMSDRQDYLVSTTLESLIIRDTGMGIKTPTLVYAIGSQVRIIPGSIDEKELQVVADFAT
jgi:hypothetical protein